MTALHQPTETDLLARLSSASRGTAPQYLAAAREALVRLLGRPGLLNESALKRVPGGLARNLLFGDGDISIWAMVWDKGARTPIHDHHCSCCFAVLSGVITERRFRRVGEERAAVVEQAMRAPGYVACMLPSGPNIHQMVNASEGEAISLHVYGYDHNAHASSIERIYRLAAA
jgi:predicted metal-dependent enzyme (double-stranded beta helix superfamily)